MFLPNTLRMSSLIGFLVCFADFLCSASGRSTIRVDRTHLNILLGGDQVVNVPWSVCVQGGHRCCEIKKTPVVSHEIACAAVTVVAICSSQPNLNLQDETKSRSQVRCLLSFKLIFLRFYKFGSRFMFAAPRTRSNLCVGLRYQ